MFQYLGGLSLAVRTQSGKTPEQLILDNRNASSVRLTPLKRFIAAELRTRSLNPEWIAALQNENYAGARMIARTVDNLWGWQSVTPENIDPSQWNELYEVYLKDRYRLGLRKFFTPGQNSRFPRGCWKRSGRSSGMLLGRSGRNWRGTMRRA